MLASRAQPLVAPTHPLEHQQHQRRDYDQDRRHGSDRRADVVANAAEHLPRQRRLLGTREEQRHHDFVEQCRERKQRSGNNARCNEGQRDLEEVGQRIRAETRRRAHQVVVESLQRCGDCDDDEWQAEDAMTSRLRSLMFSVSPSYAFWPLRKLTSAGPSCVCIFAPAWYFSTRSDSERASVFRSTALVSGCCTRAAVLAVFSSAAGPIRAKLKL